MSDETKKENAVPAEDAQKQAPELSNDEMNKAVGGAFNAFVNFGDIKGESTDKDHKDWIEILSYDHSVTQTQPKS
jgi:type VI protein secretion system component Hcp